MTVGRKIKRARKLMKRTTDELGHLVQLNADRIRTYEADIRTPKKPLLEKISKALGIPMAFFVDHKIDTYDDFFQIFFELEDEKILTVEKAKNGEYVLKFNNYYVESQLKVWYEKKEALKNGKCSKEEYDIWRARFPLSVADEMHNIIEA